MASFSGVPLPPNTEVTAPGSDVPATLAVFSGRWGGTWDGVLPSLVIVESVAADGSIRGVYAWGSYGSVTPGSTRFRTTVNGSTFAWGSDSKFEFTMKDGKLHGERIRSGNVNTVVMAKVQ